MQSNSGSLGRRFLTRLGFTVIELLVAMVIIGILIALILPAITGSRDSARRLQCLSNMRNVGLALASFEAAQRRLPASGNWGHDASLNSFPLHTWAVTILPYVEQQNLFNQWDRDKSLEDPVNEPLTREQVPVYQCPADISLLGKGDLSYAVNGGIGYTTRHANGARDVPVNMDNDSLDLNGDGVFPHDTMGTDASPTDRDLYERMGLFFMETWTTQITKRSHALADVMDGGSQTFLLLENVRVGADPNYARGSFANPDPARCAVYYQDPCGLTHSCSPANVRYEVVNQASRKINSGLTLPEGESPIANSFHTGGVNVFFADGSGRFLSENIDGAVYAALFSPQGNRLTGLPLQQVIVSNDF